MNKEKEKERERAKKQHAEKRTQKQTIRMRPVKVHIKTDFKSNHCNNKHQIWVRNTNLIPAE